MSAGHLFYVRGPGPALTDLYGNVTVYYEPQRESPDLKGKTMHVFN